MENILSIDWQLIMSHLFSAGIAYLLALPVAWDQEERSRSAGLRTFPLVAMASCGYLLLAINVFTDKGGDQARVLQGLISGIGFIGGGAILKDGLTVKGLATAASIWNTGAIGAAVAYKRYEIAIVLSLLNFFTLRVLTKFKEDEEPKDEEKAEDSRD
jgi:putative Mg2+ transporter-C (MgtC) family protein